MCPPSLGPKAAVYFIPQARTPGPLVWEHLTAQRLKICVWGTPWPQVQASGFIWCLNEETANAGGSSSCVCLTERVCISLFLKDFQKPYKRKHIERTPQSGVSGTRAEHQPQERGNLTEHPEYAAMIYLIFI